MIFDDTAFAIDWLLSTEGFGLRIFEASRATNGRLVGYTRISRRLKIIDTLLRCCILPFSLIAAGCQYTAPPSPRTILFPSLSKRARLALKYRTAKLAAAYCLHSRFSLFTCRSPPRLLSCEKWTIIFTGHFSHFCLSSLSTAAEAALKFSPIFLAD